jgi:predicted  nucleic acid-binding Zn-ribbon protein
MSILTKDVESLLKQVLANEATIISMLERLAKATEAMNERSSKDSRAEALDRMAERSKAAAAFDTLRYSQAKVLEEIQKLEKKIDDGL